MAKFFLAGLVLIFAICVVQTNAWSGNVCSRTICSYKRVRVCAYRTWAGCCWYKWIWKPDYRVIRFCCAGWTTSSSQKCDRAICNPSCKNGGTCVRPNVCRCRDGAIGTTCNTLVCNWQRPCFPGECVVVGGGIPSCNCKSGFETPLTDSTANYCRNLRSDEKPEIFTAKARLSFWERGTGRPPMEKYNLYVDSTMMTEPDLIWTNRFMFNRLEVNASAQYVNAQINSTDPPNFIGDFGVGISKAEAYVLHEKILGAGTVPNYVSFEDTLSCSPSVSATTPKQDTYYCDISKEPYDRSFENGDKLTVILRTWSGGFRDLTTLSGLNRRSQTFDGHKTESSMIYRFDLKKPTHSCLDTQCTTNTAFYIEDDITKNALVLKWSDWTDVLSQMHRYAWEVFKLEVDGNNVLREPKPLEPMHGPIEVNQTDLSGNSYETTFTPPGPGVYSIILEASDQANNSVFIRRIAIYDDSSSVTVDSSPDRRLFVSSANPDGDYNWQQNPGQPTAVTWTNHFVNLVHESGKWLTGVLAYPKELENSIKNIPRDSQQDDHEGKRTVDEIANRRGVVKFQIARKKDSNNGQNQPDPTNAEWTDVYLNETYTFPADPTITSSDTLTVWVKATDSLGNTRIDKSIVHFDDTPPDALTPVFNRNSPALGVPYSSTINVDIADMQSGMKRVDFLVLKAGTNTFVNNHTMPIPPRSTLCPNVVSGCYCPVALSPTCYDKQHVLAISNCMLWQEKDLDNSQSVDVHMDFMNMAGLVTRKTVTINNIAQLNGTRTHLGPRNLSASDVTGTTATVTWTHSSSCYDRTEMWINYLEDGEAVMTKLHYNAVSHNLARLKPGTTYTVQLISQYGLVKSDPVDVVITTVANDTGLSAGAVAGIAIGSLLFIILILILLGFVLWKLGYLAALASRRDKYKEERRVETPHIVSNPVKNTNRPVSQWAFTNTTYQPTEEIYIYGSMDLGEPWYVPKDEVTLMEEIATGRFAKIYKAKWRESPKNIKDVACKVLKNRENEDNIMLMLAKINFASSQVGEHRNVLGFLGAVMDNDALGPMMVLEYCECGTMDKWLQKKKSSVNEDVLDRMQTFALDIARAMEYLASKGIPHRKLAARNCLLTFLLEVKVTGFGPCQTDESADDKGDRIPIKWTAPECLKSLKNANEKSDAWSYGVTLWEIFSMGGSPYSEIRGRDLASKVNAGYRMSRPEYAEDIHYALMQDCWKCPATARPDFRNIVYQLEASFGLRPDGGDQNYYYQR